MIVKRAEGRESRGTGRPAPFGVVSCAKELSAGGRRSLCRWGRRFKVDESKSSSSVEPKWLAKIKNLPPVVTVISLFSLAVSISVGAKAIVDLFNSFKTPESFVLAEISAKSVFSDQFTQRAWRRLFWADNFLGRVRAQTMIQDVDDAWKHYIDADAEWNANIMISYVGLETHYDRTRRRMLEHYIQPGFQVLDMYLAAIRNGPLVNNLRTGEHNSRVLTPIDCASAVSRQLKAHLYVLVGCTLPDQNVNLCNNDDFNDEKLLFYNSLDPKFKDDLHKLKSDWIDNANQCKASLK